MSEKTTNAQLNAASKADSQEDTADELPFACEGKCRICPFPGARCASGEVIRRSSSLHGNEDGSRPAGESGFPQPQGGKM